MIQEAREQMTCSNCPRLRAEYEKRRRASTAAIHDLANNGVTSSREEYAVMKIAMMDARLAWEASGMELLKHQQTHQSAS
jgi:hypothetical protein